MYIVSLTCGGHSKDHSMSRVSFMILKGAQCAANYSPFAVPKLMQFANFHQTIYTALHHQSAEDRKVLGQHSGQGPGPENSNGKLLLTGETAARSY